jgi:transposase
VRAAYGGEATGPSPVDRSKPGSKHHVITDARGIPLASSVTAADRNDVSEMAPLVNELPEVAGEVGHPRRQPDALQGDLAYDSEPHREGLRQMGIDPVLPEKGIDEDSGLGETRWPVERTLSWAHPNRRLRSRYERRPDIHQAFLTLACIKICASALFSGLC